MIASIEGCDCSGKTTLFTSLHPLLPDAVFVRVSHPTTDYDGAERRQLELWDAVYDPLQLYVCDRSVFISSPVYAELYKRPPFRIPDRWREDLLVLYLNPGLPELLRRHTERGETPYKLPETLALFNKYIRPYRTIINPSLQDAVNFLRYPYA